MKFSCERCGKTWRGRDAWNKAAYHAGYPHLSPSAVLFENGQARWIVDKAANFWMLDTAEQEATK